MKQHPDFKNLYVSSHPLVSHKLSHIRATTCDKAGFETGLREISLLMAYELTSHLEMGTKKVTTPICEMDAPVLKGQPPVIVPILRAGLGMSVGFDAILPEAPVGHIGLFRDPETKQPVEYLVRLPQLKGRQVILVDPMLATGYSAAYAIGLLMRHGAVPADIRMMVLVAAPEGVEAVAAAWPDVKIFTAALDTRLNENAYIVPGLGDAGDRLFGTDHH